MTATAIYTRCFQVGVDEYVQAYETREVELPDDFFQYRINGDLWDFKGLAPEHASEPPALKRRQ